MATSFTVVATPAAAAADSLSRENVCGFTYQDAVDHLCDFMGGSALDSGQRLVRQAVQNAYTRFVNERSWRYLNTHGRVNLNASYDTGTVSFDLTGGTYERQLTFSTALSSTVQGWVKFGRIRINDVVYEIDDYKTTTVVTLTADHCPTEDLTDETFTLYRNQYPFRCGFRKMGSFTAEDHWGSCYVPPAEWIYSERHDNATGTPLRWTLLSDPEINGAYVLCVEPYPTSAETLDFPYQRAGRAIRYSGYESATRTGNVTISADARVVTGVGTAWTSDMQGSYMRFTQGSTCPDGLGGLNPYLEQRKIRSVTNTQSLVLDTAVDFSYSSKPFVITDPVDLPETFWEAFCACCRWQLAMTGRVKDVSTDQSSKHYQTALRRCFEMDNLTEIPRRFGGDVQYYDRGWGQPLGDNIE
jgi:hypothetical protein